MPRRRPHFQPKFKGRNLLRERVARSGISYSAALEWRFAAQWANYRYEDFVKLSGEQQAAHVAAYRIKTQEEAVLAREQVRAMKQANARGQRKGK